MKTTSSITLATLVVSTSLLLDTGCFAAIAVTWGGTDYVTATQRYRNTDGTVSTGAEWGDDGLNDDVLRNFAYSESTELNPIIGAGYVSTSTNNARFYGGIQEWNLDSTNTASVNSTGEDVQNNAGGDRNVLDATNNATKRYYAAFAWSKADFQNGLDSTSDLIFNTSSSLSVNITENTAGGGNPHFDTRFMVKDGTQWYLSNTVSSGAAPTTLTLSGAALTSETWALYDPAANLQANPGVTDNDAGGASGELTYLAHTFTDITFLGIYTESTDNSAVGNRKMSWDTFSADVTSVPEPSSAALLLGGCGMLLGFRRRS